MSDNEMKMVLSVGSDTNSGDYYMYDRAKNSLAYLGLADLDCPKTMSPMKPFSLKREMEKPFDFNSTG